jgi:glutamine amidotransferase
MKNINAKGLVKTLQQLKQPVLGFCLGMQLMTESSTEGVNLSLQSPSLGTTASDLCTVSCLGVIPTMIVPLSVGALRLPHMGWNTLTTISEHPILKDINVGDYFYFVHSYAAPVSQYTLASCQYGQSFSAVIAKNNFIGCQFHPERSSKLGSKIINNFLNL